MSVTAVDAANNISASTEVKVKDTTAPPAPIVNPIYKKDMLITGYSEVNSYVVVTEGKKIFKVVKANDKGEFSILLSKPLNPNTVLYFVSIDDSANISPMTTVVVKK